MCIAISPLYGKPPYVCAHYLATLTKRRLKRGVLRSVAELCEAINRYIEAHNDQPKPFVWTADPNRIIAAVNRGRNALESIH